MTKKLLKFQDVHVWRVWSNISAKTEPHKTSQFSSRGEHRLPMFLLQEKVQPLREFDATFEGMPSDAGGWR